MDLKEAIYGGRDFIQLAHGSVQFEFFVKTVITIRIPQRIQDFEHTKERINCWRMVVGSF
jgi:hypothetical protein